MRHPERMARRTTTLPGDRDEEARRLNLDASALARRAIVGELDRLRRMAAIDAWLDELDEAEGAPSRQASDRAEA